MTDIRTTPRPASRGHASPPTDAAARIEPAGGRNARDGVEILTPEQAWVSFDRQARELLGVSGEEFVRRWDAGEYDAVADQPGYTDLVYLAMLRPVDRPIGR
jgi:hypothetical protein